jgi:hypothetical protein
MRRSLGRRGDGSPNFDVELQTRQVTERKLKLIIDRLCSAPDDVALLYFAGHGIVTSTGGLLMAADAMAYDGWDGKSGCYGCELDAENMDGLLREAGFETNRLPAAEATGRGQLGP